MKDENTGKKVFFIYPHSVIQEELINIIVDNEYEVYMVKNHNKLYNINNIYSNSIVFINIDEGLPEEEWEKLIRSYSEDGQKKNLDFGILTYNEDQNLAQKYLMEIMVSCGYIRLKLGLEESIKIILRTLEANEAKGKRKYVRARPQKEDASFNFKNGEGKIVSGQINDISSIGMAMTLNEEMEIKKHSLLKDIQIKIKGGLIKVSGVVIGSRKVVNSNTIYVLLFDKSATKEVKHRLRLYIHKLLQDDVNKVLMR